MGKLGDAKMRIELAFSFLAGEDKSRTLAIDWTQKGLLIANDDDRAYAIRRISEIQRDEAGVVDEIERMLTRGMGDHLKKDSSGCLFAALLECATAGHPCFEYALAEAYYFGHGCEENETAALEWYRHAADHRHAEAIQSLAGFYRHGNCGLEENSAKAAELFKQALDILLERGSAGDAHSQFVLARTYRYGKGVEANDADAFVWMLKSAEAGCVDAMSDVSDYYCAGSGVEKDCEKAFGWFVRAAEAGCEGAQSVLSCNFYHGGKVQGIEIEQDYSIAFRYAALGAEQHENAGCLEILGRCYYHGRGVEEENGKAFAYFKKSADKGNVVAMDYLGDCYKNGYGVDESKSEAKRWYKLAADKGSESAAESLQALEKSDSGW